MNIIVIAGCGGGGGGGSSALAPSGGGGGGTNNVVAVSVNGPLCLQSGSYVNEPCVSVTVCAPGASNCQTIDGILLDTASFGLRIFKSALNGLSLTPEQSGQGGELAECQPFLDGSSDWGPVETGQVILGGEPAVTVPIQVIDSTFPGIPSSCTNPDLNPSEAGFNGILGVGPFVQDCGPACEDKGNINQFTVWPYWSCNAGTCTQTAVALQNQVQNPVASLPEDNNGVLMELPSVAPGGTPSISGSLILGIGTKSNNTPGAVKTFPLDSFGDFITVFNGASLTSSFADTGSNGFFFPDKAIVVCSDTQSWYCPPSTKIFSATQEGFTNTPTNIVSFQIGNFDNLTKNTSNAVFLEIGGPSPDPSAFDWGLPFYFGRSVFMGIEGTDSPLGAGPYLAY